MNPNVWAYPANSLLYSLMTVMLWKVKGTIEGLNKSLPKIRYSPPNKAVQTRYPGLKLKTVMPWLLTPRHTNKRE